MFWFVYVAVSTDKQVFVGGEKICIDQCNEHHESLVLTLYNGKVYGEEEPLVLTV